MARPLMKWVRNVAVAVLIVFVALLVWAVMGARSFRNRAAKIKLGDSREQVRAVLGQPNGYLKTSGSSLGVFLVGGYPEWWTYRFVHHPFTRKFPWLACLSFDFSLKPDTNDVAVYFDSSGKVVRVYIPQK